ncbi:hypothetical protein AGMMS49992_18920 [Clostridia bacterium]|nr:hypothetical protein AGMMS49992_18920 [Clostridia bacterium]
MFAILFYDKKYCSGKWFSGKYYGFASTGWYWVYHDLKNCLKQQVNMGVPWPVSSRVTVHGAHNIVFHPDDLNNFQGFGNYYQAIGEISIGRGTYIAPNVGIITANHDLINLDRHLASQPVTIGEQCWIGMNSVILPGVTLGKHTIIGAGSVVTKSFPEGYCVIAGNPAKLIHKLEGTENDQN